MDAELGQASIAIDQPEYGLVTITYEAGLNEWNLSDGSEKSLVMPEPAFRKIAEDFLAGKSA